MKEIIIDCTGLGNPRELHAVLAEKLGFPEWYGHNLDALHDLLTSITEDTHLILLHPSGFSNGFCRVMIDAEAENSHFQVTIE